MILSHPSLPASRRLGGRERGSALLWAVALMSATTALIVSDMDVMRANTREKAVEFAENGQAAGVAAAGLNDALAWLRRQRVQPVLTFAPARNLTADPPVNETDDPALGLVREYEMSPGIWARYEVRTGRAMDPYTDSNQNGEYDAGETFIDLARPGGALVSLTQPADQLIAGRQHDGYSDGKWTPAKWTRDVSTERGWAARGTVWRIESLGLVYRRERADLPLGREPNVLLASVKASSEVRRLVVTPPATAAVCASSTTNVVIGDRVRVRAPGGLAFALQTSTGTVTVPTASEVLATTRSAAVPGYDATVKRVFGVDWAELKALADISSQRLAGVPDQIVNGNLVVLERDVTYNAALPLEGSGVLVVKGNLTLSPDSKSYFSGVLYVNGNLTIHAPALVRGTIICTGRVELRGSAGDYVEVESDPAMVARLTGLISAYRFARAAYTPDPRMLDTTLVGGDPWSAATAGGRHPYEPPPTYGDDNADDDRPPNRR